MSAFMFGVRCRGKRLPAKQRAIRERVAKELEVTWIEIREPTREYKSWFVGPNYGHPFDADLQRDATRLIALYGGSDE